MQQEPVLLPDGTPFVFWDDQTRYTKVYHVAQKHPAADDGNEGDAEHPFATISRAAQALRPGQKAIVHEGVYRECVRPARGGTSPEAIVCYQAAPGERVVVKGSEEWRPQWRISEGWLVDRPEARVWMADLPEEWLVGYNPFVARNVNGGYFGFNQNQADWRRDEIDRMLLRCGMIFLDGRPLRQVGHPGQLRQTPGAFWVEHGGLRIHLRMADDSDPNGRAFEVTTRQQILVPAQRGTGYIRLSGFVFEHAADPPPSPWRAMVSAWRGHHWIIEDCVVRHANAVGIDVGNEALGALGRPDEQRWTRHIIRRNHVSDCGISGIAAIDANWGTLVEDNVVERIGSLNLERVWEAGGLKFHQCNGVLIRRNTFRQMRHAPGIWLDYLNRNTRVTQNVVCDVEGILGGIYIEATHAPVLIDHNVVWDIRGDFVPADRDYSGPGINIDSSECCRVEHNLVGQVRDSYGVLVHLTQHARKVAGRTGLCRRHAILNNIIAACPKRVLLGTTTENRCEGNLYDGSNDLASFCVQYPAPTAMQNLAGWREHFGFDRDGAQARVDASLDPETRTLLLRVEGDLPEQTAGPLNAGQWASLRAGQTVRAEIGKDK
jgi:hypothetical protein